jgi:starch phosphorylase
MKVLVNGGLNLSFRDGWWDEAYRPEVGWAPEGDGTDDGRDAARLYELLEHEVIATFYDRDPEGLPRGWVARMRASMAELTPVYSANRALREYCEHYYLHAADSFAARSGDGAKHAASLVALRRLLEQHWGDLRFGEVRVQHEGGKHRFAAALYVDDLDADAIAVELYADARGGDPPVRVRMQRGSPLIGARGFTYVADVSDDRPAGDFTPRAVPASHQSLGALELPFVLWAS